MSAGGSSFPSCIGLGLRAGRVTKVDGDQPRASGGTLWRKSGAGLATGVFGGRDRLLLACYNTWRRTYLMDTNRILAILRAERERIEHAISAIEGLSSTGGRKAGRPPKAATSRPGRRRISTAARRRLSLLLKQRWAQGKMKPRAKAKPLQAKPARRLSKAARRKIAAAQRARWAKAKAQERRKSA